MTEIALSAIPAQRFQIVLADQYCTITLREKGNRIYLDLDTTDYSICRGAICVNGADVLQSLHPQFYGTLHFFDTIGDSAPRYELLDTRYVLLYVEDGEQLPEALRY